MTIRYRVRYTFAGAPGIFDTCTTLVEAELAVHSCQRHFFGLATVWIEEKEE